MRSRCHASASWVVVAAVVALMAGSCGRGHAPAWREGSAWGVYGPPEELGNPDFGVRLFMKGDSVLIRFEVGVGRDSTGSMQWKTLDEARISVGPDSSVITTPSSPCYVAGVPDRELFAMVPRRSIGDVQPLRAWRANRKTGRIEEVPSEGIRCVRRVMGY